MGVRCDRLSPVFLSPDSFDLFIALNATKVPAKRGIFCLSDTPHADQQRAVMHSRTLNFLLLAVNNVVVVFVQGRKSQVGRGGHDPHILGEDVIGPPPPINLPTRYNRPTVTDLHFL